MGNCTICLRNQPRPSAYQWEDIELDYLSSNEVQIIANPLLKIQKGDLPSAVCNSIGFLVFKNYLGATLNSTAVIISPNLILTSARNVYDNISKQDYKDFKFFPAVNGEIKQLQGYPIQAYRYPAQYKNCAMNRKLRYEYALLKLSSKSYKSISSDQCLKIVPACTECPVEDTKRLSLYGYTMVEKILRGLTQYWSANQSGISKENLVITYKPKELRINYSASAKPGLRGSPVMFGGHFVGIHVGSAPNVSLESNLGRLFTYDLLRNLNEWCTELLADKFTIDDTTCQHIIDQINFGRQSLASNGRALSDIAQAKSGSKVNNQLNLLDLRSQSLTTFQFSAYKDIQKIFAKKNFFVNIDLRTNTKLTQLGLTQNQLQSIDLSKNIQLQKLSLSQNRIKELDISNNIKLTELGVRNNLLQKLDVSKNDKIVKLHLRKNKLDSIDLSNNPAINELGLSENKLQHINVSQNLQLVQAGFSSNQLQFIDLKSNNKLKFLNLSNNKIRTVDLSNNIQLTELDLSSNLLDFLDIKKNTSIIDINLSKNNLVTIDLSNNAALRKLKIDNNRIIVLDLTKNIQLNNLSLAQNQIVALNLKKNLLLFQLDLHNNRIPSIDLLNQQNLQILNVQNNTLENLNISKSKYISQINAANNKLSSFSFWFNDSLFNKSQEVRGVGFSIAHQNKSMCMVTILHNQNNKQICDEFKSTLESEYSEVKNNKNNCKYIFTVDKG